MLQERKSPGKLTFYAEKSRFFAQILLVHVSGRDVSVTETSRKNLHFTKTNGTKWIITNGLSPFSTGNIKVKMTMGFVRVSRTEYIENEGSG